MSRQFKPVYQKDNYSIYDTNGVGLILYSDAEKLCEPLPKINVYLHDSGMMATHNMPCPVCVNNHAIVSNGVFQPCWSCQEAGWSINKSSTFIKKWYNFWK